jgi:putative phosphoribosyl transferase
MIHYMQYLDRRDAGRRLAAELTPLAAERPAILAVPRGGVAVAGEVARALQLPLDIVAVRKIGAPGNPELAVGAVVEDGTGVLDSRSADMLGMTPDLLDERLEQEARELERRVACYRAGRPPLQLDGRTVIVVDDGMATGMTELAAVRAVRERGARRVIVAVPVASSEAVETLEKEADLVISLTIPRRLYGVGMWYGDFAPVSDEEVVEVLSQARADCEARGAADQAEAGAAGQLRDPEPRLARAPEELSYELDGTQLRAILLAPAHARAMVVFAHGSGSSRLSPRNQSVAKALAEAGYAALLLDLLAEHESARRELTFDIGLLSARLGALTTRACAHASLRGLPVGFFGASTGAAAALSSAAALGGVIAAVVSRGGRPDLAGEALERVSAPTRLIVGGLDGTVLELNRDAARRLRCEHDLVVVDGAGHLFEEPGALERVAVLAIEWFQRHLG